MATALDAFVVSIAVDSNGVIKGIKDATGAIHVLEKDARKSGRAIEAVEKIRHPPSKKQVKVSKRQQKRWAKLETKPLPFLLYSQEELPFLAFQIK
ncbi:hypothetical protein FAI40_10040 [Acetobacteraceae bacterium]|nr:hypothetical protein FAI40_10040 [Acetobacteraceae bacterium]